MSIFDELQTSLQEAVDIKQGKAQASRTTRHEVADVKASAPSCMSLRRSLLKRWEPVWTPSKAGKPSAVTLRD